MEDKSVLNYKTVVYTRKEKSYIRQEWNETIALVSKGLEKRRKRIIELMRQEELTNGSKTFKEDKSK